MAVRSLVFVLLTCIFGTYVFQKTLSPIFIDGISELQNIKSLFERKFIAKGKQSFSSNIDDYYKFRAEFKEAEINAGFGGDIELNEKEILANEIIMDATEKELNAGIINPYKFNPSRHIFEVLDTVNQSKVFQFIQKMPKGGILHSHDTYINTADYAVSLTYWPNLWQRTVRNSDNIEEFRFSRDQPKKSYQNLADSDEPDSTWRLVKEVREEIGASNYDKHIRQLFTLFDKNKHPLTQYKDINDVWDHFMDIRMKFEPIVTFAPIWKEYYKNALREMLNDGVQYLEFRGDLPKLYDLDGREYNEISDVAIYIEATEEFKYENPLFIGSKLIYSGGKRGSNKTIAGYFEIIRRLHELFPNFVVGFDLAGQEDKAIPLVEFAEQILQLPEDIKLFFHAGETNWFGSTDENLIDAVLLGSRRIGHGFGLAKHPKLLEYIKKNDIAVEVNPLSNQVLKLVDDIRNHPATVLLSQNIPIVISSDNLSLWEVSPLSHDFYYTFMGIASRHCDLRLLKKLAINSIQYSALNPTETSVAFAKWQGEWDKYIEILIQSR